MGRGVGRGRRGGLDWEGEIGGGGGGSNGKGRWGGGDGKGGKGEGEKKGQEERGFHRWI